MGQQKRLGGEYDLDTLYMCIKLSKNNFIFQKKMNDSGVLLNNCHIAEMAEL